jgi:hypothetical protein
MLRRFVWALGGHHKGIISAQALRPGRVAWAFGDRPRGITRAQGFVQDELPARLEFIFEE